MTDRNVEPPVDNAAGQNVTVLDDRLGIDSYPSPHSDIVALMVLEHQILVHNRLTNANFEARRALYYQDEMNRALGEREGTRLESVTRRIESAGDELVDALLLVDEAELRLAGKALDRRSRESILDVLTEQQLVTFDRSRNRKSRFELVDEPEPLAEAGHEIVRLEHPLVRPALGADLRDARRKTPVLGGEWVRQHFDGFNRAAGQFEIEIAC